jgi:hypothetical protein
MKVGVDFDNTIVSYEKVFHQVGLEKSLIDSNVDISKISVRNHLISSGKNDIWTELQGYVYGKRMLDAEVFPGFINFLNFANKNKIQVLIVSHKTIYPYIGKKYNLHDSAREFISKYLTNQNKNLISKKNIFFELTQKDKAMRVHQESCDYFVDDLPEIFALKEFPSLTKKILFDPNNKHNNFENGVVINNWKAIQDIVRNDFFRR